jgi:diacylglycerol O-acyltransferase / wax synthase
VSPATHQLSSADAAWLHMDRPTNLMVINCVLLFEEPLDWGLLSEIVRMRLVERYPHFRQRVSERRGLRGPRWEEDPDFDLSRHLHRRGLPAPRDESALTALVSDLAAMPLDRGRPLWDWYLIDGPGEGSAIVVRVHHCIADGIALARVLLSLADNSPERVSAPRRPRPAGGLDFVLRPARCSVSSGIRLARSLAGTGLETARHPHHALEIADELAAEARSLAKLVFSPAEESTLLKDDLGAPRAFAWSAPIPLERVRTIAHAHNATVNDVLLAAVSGGLRGYLMARGERPHELRAWVPYNLRAAGEAVPRELGNHFGLVLLTLPVDRSRRLERLRELKRRMRAIKRSPEGPVSYAALGAVGLTPPQVEARLVDLFTAKASAVSTNVPGPRETLHLAGVPVRTVLVWAPTAGGLDMSLSIFSYRGEVTVGLLVHADVVPDPESIIERVEAELDAIARLRQR